MPQQKLKHYATRFNFDVASLDVHWVGTLAYLSRTDTDQATWDAIQKASFMAATYGFEFNPFNLSVTLRPL